jgi:type I restriction enzyme S subunit
MCSTKFINQILEVAVGQTMPSLNTVIVGNLKISIPPLKEQEAIAEALSDADAAIESFDALIAKKRDVKQAMMQQLLTGRTRLPGFTGDWKEVALCKVAHIGPGINKALSEMGTGSLYVTVEDIYYGSFLDVGRLGRIRISKSEVERFSLEVGDLVLGKSSVKRDGIGYPNLFLGCAEPVVPSGFTYRVRPDRSLLSSKFLLQYLRSRPGRKWIIDNSQSSALTNINSSIINKYPVTLPPLNEQEEIAEVLTVMDDELEALTEQVSKLRMVKEGMMQDLLTGKVRLV